MAEPTIEVLFQVFSSLATLAAFLVLLTAITFPSMYKRLFMKIVVMISLCDIMASAFSAVGFPSKSSPLCPVQAFFTIFGYKSSWLWTTALAYELYSVCLHGRFVPMLYLHVICWSVGLISTLLPLSTNGYGRDNQDDGTSWCFINGNTHSGAIWAAVSFQVLLIVTSLMTLYFTFRIYWRYRFMNITKDYPEVHVILDTMILYPLGFFITWGPNLIFSLLINFEVINFDRRNQHIFHIVTIIATQSGLVLAIIFFIKSKEARFRWALLLGCVTGRSTSKTPSRSNLLSEDASASNKNTDDEHSSSQAPKISSIHTSSSGLSVNLAQPIPIHAPTQIPHAVMDFEEDEVIESRFQRRIFSTNTSSSCSNAKSLESNSSSSSYYTVAKSSDGSTTLSRSLGGPSSDRNTLNSQPLLSGDSVGSKRQNHLFWNNKANSGEDNYNIGFSAGSIEDGGTNTWRNQPRSDGDETRYVKF
jgi:hypothetical protein